MLATLEGQSCRGAASRAETETASRAETETALPGAAVSSVRPSLCSSCAPPHTQQAVALQHHRLAHYVAITLQVEAAIRTVLQLLRSRRSHSEDQGPPPGLAAISSKATVVAAGKTNSQSFHTV